jgi:hypothetical protein
VVAALPDGDVPLKPSSVTERYDRLASRLGIDTTLHKLRHYSATEPIGEPLTGHTGRVAAVATTVLPEHGPAAVTGRLLAVTAVVDTMAHQAR